MKSARTYAALACALALCGPALAQTAPEAGLTPPVFGAWGLDLAGRDLAVKAGDDFNRYANGRYLDQIQIPPDRTGWGVNYQLSALSEAQVRAILEEKAKAGGDGEAGKIGRFYAAFMDEARAEALGAKPLQPWLARTRAARSKADIAAIMGTAPKDFPSAIFGLYIDADPKNPDRYTINLFQGGLGLPDRDYYLSAQFADKKAKYQAYVAEMLRLAGWPDPAGHAKAIVALETKIARASWTKAQQRDPVKTYNPMSPGALAKLAPGFPWKPFLAAADLGATKRLIVSEKSAFPKIAAVFAAAPLDTLKAWVAFNLADNAAPYLSKAFTDARFEFRSKTLSGQLEQRPRWKRAVAAVDGAMGEAVGQIYVQRHFPPEAQAKIEALVDDLKVAFRARLQRLPWMDSKTKAEALKKLGQFHVKVGHPTKWRDYSKLSV
ncbi:MAG: M13 family metallopeptidase N-terminal domain-containing protein, partial [Caulobacteraceae bacterium]